MRAFGQTTARGNVWIPAVLILALGACQSPRRSAAPAAHRADPPAAAMAAYARGIAHDLRGKPAEAAEAYLRAIDLDPSRSAPYLRVVAAHGELRRRGMASAVPEWLASIARAHRDESEPMRWLARLHAEENRPEEALRAFNRAIRIHPDRVALHVERALHLIRTQETKALPGAFREAFSRMGAAPEFAVPAAAWARAAHADEDASSKASALRVMDRLRRARGMPTETLVAMAQAYHDIDEAARARHTFTQARDADPERAETYLVWAFVYMRDHDYAPARAILLEGSRAAAQPMDLLHLLVEAALRHSIQLSEQDEEAKAIAARNEAIEAARRLLESAPRDVHARMRLADLLTLAGKPEEAVAVLRRLSGRDPELRGHLLRRYLAADAAGEAITWLEEIAEEAPLETESLAVLTELLSHGEQYARAIEILQRAVRAGNQDPELRIRLAILLVQADRPDEAFDAVRNAVETLGQHPGLIELGVHLSIDRGLVEEAIEWIDRLEETDPRDAESGEADRAAYRALARQADGQHEAAADLLLGAAEEDAGLLQRFVHLAHRLYRDRKDDDPTPDTLAVLEHRKPRDARILLHRGLQHHLAGQYEQAVERYERAQEAANGDEDASGILTAHFFFLFGAASERSGRDVQAMDHLAEAIRLDPDHADALNYLAYMWSERSMNLDQALDYVRRALEFDPDNAAYIDTLGWIYFQQGRLDEAKVELFRALEKKPDDPTIADHVGDVLHRLDRTDEAVVYWKRAMKHDPENPEEIREKLREAGAEPPGEKELPPDAETPAPDGNASTAALHAMGARGDPSCVSDT